VKVFKIVQRWPTLQHPIPRYRRGPLALAKPTIFLKRKKSTALRVGRAGGMHGIRNWDPEYFF
jgi:hypothetical protein